MHFIIPMKNIKIIIAQIFFFIFLPPFKIT